MCRRIKDCTEAEELCKDLTYSPNCFNPKDGKKNGYIVTRKNHKSKQRKMKQITSSELNKLCFCNSDKLLSMKVISDGKPHEWVGVGWVECDEPITDEMYEIAD